MLWGRLPASTDKYRRTDRGLYLRPQLRLRQEALKGSIYQIGVVSMLQPQHLVVTFHGNAVSHTLLGQPLTEPGQIHP